MSEKRKNILFIVTKSEPGGAQKFVYEQIIISKDNFNCFLATDAPGWLYLAASPHIKGSLLDEKIKHVSLLYLITLTKFIYKNDIDLVICNSAYAGIYGRVVSVFTRKKSIFVSHGWSSVYQGKGLSFIFNKIEKWLSYITSHILCISGNDRRIAIEKIGISQNKLIVIQNKIFSQYSAIKSRFTYTEPIKILTVARLDHPKRIDLALSALGNHPGIHVYVVGGGSQESMLKEIVLQDKITNFSFMGSIQNFSSFQEYDLFLLLSDSEGLPMSAIEAMSCGLPLLLSDVGGCNELIDNNGVLVINEIEPIRSGISKCIHMREHFQNGSFTLFNKKFNLALNSSEYIDFYTNVLNNN